MLDYLLLILVCQLLGEAAVTLLDASFPGPVAGMLMLFGFLVIRGEVPPALGRVATIGVTGLLMNFLDRRSAAASRGDDR